MAKHKIEPIMDFYTLNDNELELYNSLGNLLKESQNQVHASKKEKIEENIANIIIATDLKIIIKFIEKSSTFAQFLQAEIFDDFWKEVWRNMGKNASKEYSVGFLPQKQITCMNLFLGNFYYNRSRLIREQSENQYTPEELKYLYKAQEYNSFHALNALNKYDLNNLNQAIINKQNIDLQPILDRATKAKIHLTPGYVLLAETCCAIAEYNKKVLRSDAAVESSYLMAIKYISLGKVFLSQSKNSINNAYYGKGFSFCNNLGLNTFEKIAQSIYTLAENYLEPGIKESLKRNNYTFFSAQDFSVEESKELNLHSSKSLNK